MSSSEIPSNLSKWEPSRAMKVTFLAFAALSLITLYAAKIYDRTVVDLRKLEFALGAERLDGSPAPAFTLKDRQGNEVSLEQFRGQVVFVNFWATWCPPCREEMPSLDSMARQVENAVVLAVSVDDEWEPIDEFLGPDAKGYQVVLDAGANVSELFGTTGYPESFVIGTDGQLVYKFIGPRDWSTHAAVKILEKAGARRRYIPTT